MRSAGSTSWTRPTPRSRRCRKPWKASAGQRRPMQWSSSRRKTPMFAACSTNWWSVTSSLRAAPGRSRTGGCASIPPRTELAIVQREVETAGKPGGFFISFEGPEGGGKSTQIHRLAAALAEQGYRVWTTREPGGTRVGEMIRPRLARGELVLCDHYTDSTLAYQGYGRGLDLDTLRRLQSQATGGLQPDLTMLLNLPTETGLSRIPRAAQDRLDRETATFHQRVRAGYQEMAAADPRRWREVDAAADQDQVAARILGLVSEALAQAGVRPAERRV